MDITLSRAIFGKPLIDGYPAEDVQILALSEGVSPEEAHGWRQIAVLEPLPRASVEQSQAVGIFSGAEQNYILAHAHNQTGDLGSPVYEYINLPAEVLRALAGNLTPLLKMVEHPITLTAPLEEALPPLTMPKIKSWASQARRQCFERLFHGYGQRDIRRVLALLSAALHPRYITLQYVPGGVEQRVAIVQGLMALLPATLRGELTFATHTVNGNAGKARIVFSDTASTTTRWLVDWTNEGFTLVEDLQTPYIMHLLQYWDEDCTSFLDHIDAMNEIAVHLDADTDLGDKLIQMTNRHTLDVSVLAGDDVDIDAVKDVLMSDYPLTEELAFHYAERLLQHALETRDTEAAQIVTQRMDADPALDDKLQAVLDTALQTQPDAVYAFVRVRMQEGVSEKWKQRLQDAARAALEVVINDRDLEIVNNWLILLAREPLDYGLDPILHEGILSAQPYAHDDGALGQLLITHAVRRDREALNTLLADEALLNALPGDFGEAICEYTGNPTELLDEYGREIFLLILMRASLAQNGTLCTPAAVRQVWTMFQNDGVIKHLIEDYQPKLLIDEWIENGALYLSDEALTTLMTLMLSDERDDLFAQLAPQLATRENLTTMLVTALENSRRTGDAVLDLVSALLAEDILTQQQVIDIYVALLTASNWQESDLPLTEQLARTLRQSPDLEVSTDILWRLLDIAAVAKDELMARVAAKRLFNSIQQIDDESLLTDRLQRIYAKLQWSASTRKAIMDFWRHFVRQQPLSRLQRLEKALTENGDRVLDEAHDIVQSSIAFRRMLGNRSLPEFAEEINAAFEVLQSLAVAFDPSSRGEVGFDAGTIRSELNAHQDELSPNERRVLANNLKELSQIITTMAANRSKAQLLRSEDDVERQLLSGEQNPHGAVDLMKWLSGYLGGAQANADEDED
ncbi:MAG: hypothetical protein D6737_00420 [Chloroflexi bacterium]|nr:MAG: hypothetical protein CUN54_02910 [Phototrophicales bacterium]RMF82830.1 MAG: hypothetical protein D6737_00420 [Chloroflexota bacterium]